MRVDVFRNYSDLDIFNYDIVVMGVIDWGKSDVMNTIRSAQDDDFNYVSYINQINNQGIREINLKEQVVRTSSCEYHLEEMALSEQMFLISKISERFKKKILFYGTVRVLDKVNLKLFYNEYKDCHFVDLAFADKTDKEVFLWKIKSC